MQYEIFYSTVYPSIKASLEAEGIVTRNEYRPTADLNGLYTLIFIDFDKYESEE